MESKLKKRVVVPVEHFEASVARASIAASIWYGSLVICGGNATLHWDEAAETLKVTGAYGPTSLECDSADMIVAKSMLHAAGRCNSAG